MHSQAPYHPLQALTAGFMCIVACEANGAAEPSAVAMDDLSDW